jgi:hypothetical protein
MSEAWDRLITEMIRHMIREFLAHPAELLTFSRLSRLIASDPDVLYAIAKLRPDLFMITADDRFVKLFAEAVERIAHVGVESAIAEVRPAVFGHVEKGVHHPCGHFSSDQEILDNLTHSSFQPDSLTRNCCWRQICRVRGLNPQAIDQETWREVCMVRGYLQGRQNPRGF